MFRHLVLILYLITYLPTVRNSREQDSTSTVRNKTRAVGGCDNYLITFILYRTVPT